MVKIRFAALLVLFPVICLAQSGKHISGFVTDSKGQGIRDVICKLLNPKDSTLAFALTKKDGKYTLPFYAEGKRMAFSKMGFGSDTIPLQGDMSRFDWVLREKDIELQEVVVTSSPVSRNKDTLRYNVNAFRQKEDLYIEDVIRRLPGLEVGSNGEITYQGKSINQLNIEGMNLMGDGYNRATRNMPAEAVAQIQVIENNQPIRALEDKVHKDQATLNIKLNKNKKLRPFGEVFGSIGGTPARWDNRLNVFKISSRNQFLWSFGMNNQGNDFAPFANDLSNGDIYLQESLPSPFLRGTNATKPPISALYYLHNKSSYASMNYLHAFTKESVLRINAVCYHDNCRSEDSTYLHLSGAEPVTVCQANGLTTKRDMVKGQVQYELNSKKVYVQEAVTGMLSEIHSDNMIRSGTGMEDETVRQRPRYIQNTLNIHLNLPARLVQVSFIARWYRNDENLQSFNNGIGQEIVTRQFFMRNRVGTSFDLGRHPLLIAYIGEYKQSSFGLASDTIMTHKSHYTLHTFEPVYEVNFDRGHLEVRLPVEYIAYRYVWKDRTDKHILFSPDISFRHKVGNYYDASFNIGHNRNADTSDVPAGAVVFNNYRTVSSLPDSTTVSRMSVVSSSLSYLNTQKMLSWSLYAAWTHMKTDSYDASRYLPDLTFFYPVWANNTQTSWTVSYNIMKIFRAWGLSVRHKGNFVRTKMLLSQNEQEDYVRSNAVGYDFTVNWNKLHCLHVKFVLAGNVTWKQADRFSPGNHTLKNFYYTLRTDLFPTQTLKAYMDFSQTTTEIVRDKYAENFFVNAGMTCRLSKRMLLELAALNVLNRKVYAESFYNGASYSYYQIPLRGREFTAGIRFRF